MLSVRSVFKTFSSLNTIRNVFELSIPNKQRNTEIRGIGDFLVYYLTYLRVARSRIWKQNRVIERRMFVGRR